ncbi:MAG: hypothetical protein ACFFCM_19710 [Promethearchaeota archaeon]
MSKLSTSKELSNLYSKIESIKAILIKNAEMLKESLSIGREHQFLINHGIEGYKRKISNGFNSKERTLIKEKIFELIRKDNTLRHPHRKIMNFLIEQYDYGQDKFGEVHFSRIVKECRLGKNKAREYFEFLGEKGFLDTRTDGYRRFYRIKVDFTER